MNINREFVSLEIPLGLGEAPLSGTKDDADNVDDERGDENEAPVRAVSDETDTRDEFRLDRREDATQDELKDDDESEGDEKG